MIAVLEMVAQIKQVTDLCQLKSFREYLRRMKTAGRAVSSMAAASSQL
jgi:hypothetical protein